MNARKVVAYPLRETSYPVLPPHATWYSEADLERVQALVAQDIERALCGETLRQIVPGSRP